MSDPKRVQIAIERVRGLEPGLHSAHANILANEVERLWDKLPKSADGVHIVPGMILYVVYHGDVYETSGWAIHSDGSFGASIKIGDGGEIDGFALVECFSTRPVALEWLADMRPQETSNV